jgi:hypothetical protein
VLRVLLTALLAAAALVGTAGAAAAAPADPVQDCTPWAPVPNAHDPANDGFVNDRHGRVYPEIQHCSTLPGAPLTQWYARIVYQQYGPDTWPRQSQGIRLQLYDYTDGCHGCDVLVDTGRVPEPGVGNAFVSAHRAILDPNRLYGVNVDITYVNPPNPYWYQTGVFEFDNPY